jgi:acetate CoA/acetoacetate CoA-transferase alpha subunit
MTDKICTMEDIRRIFSDGLTVMVGGFGVPGTPFTLVDALLASGAGGLTLIKNEANEDHMGVSRLIEAGQVHKIITSHLGLNATVIGIMNRGEIEVEFYPQGILAEKIRTGGAGLFGFLTDIGIDTILREKKQTILMDGREVIVEPALTADVALIHAAVGDRSGNLVYEKSARNFNPVMATAARTVIAEVEQLVEIGALAPDQIHTPGAFVDHVVEIKKLTDEYGILAHHVI